MSLILEALKKSEQQRRVGQVPDLGTPVLVTRRQRSLFPILASAIVVAVAIGAWLHFSSPDEHAQPAEIAQVPASTKSDAGATSGTTSASKLPSDTTPQNKPVDSSALLGRPLSAYEKQRLKLTGQLPRLSRPNNRPVAPKTTAPPPTANPPAPAPATPAATPATTPTPPVATPPAAAPPSALVAEPATAPAPAPGKQAAVPYLWELPYATRKDMPPLQISMHVYADKPADRFVVIDGESYNEGDAIGDTLTVKEIRSDGVVLDASGKLFLLPAGGR